MRTQPQIALRDAAEWLGDWHPLADQLGSADGLVELGSVSRLLQVRPVQDVPSLHNFLMDYQEHILLSFELPSVRDAYEHAARHEVRELVELDIQLEEQPLLQFYKEPSRRVGQAQLRKLKPLRDDRVVQRYLTAVEQGAAHGWHTLVYGLTLAVYSLPLRQGLLGYAHQTTRGFIYAAARRLRLSEMECRLVFDSVCGRLPQSVSPLLGCVPG